MRRVTLLFLMMASLGLAIVSCQRGTPEAPAAAPVVADEPAPAPAAPEMSDPTLSDEDAAPEDSGE